MSDTTSQSPWWMLPVLAVVAESVFFTALVMAFMGDDKTLLNVMCTASIAQAGGALAYFFMSSAGSAKKDDALAVTSTKQVETIAQQSSALATSAPVNGNGNGKPS